VSQLGPDHPLVDTLASKVVKTAKLEDAVNQLLHQSSTNSLDRASFTSPLTLHNNPLSDGDDEIESLCEEDVNDDQAIDTALDAAMDVEGTISEVHQNLSVVKDLIAQIGMTRNKIDSDSSQNLLSQMSRVEEIRRYCEEMSLSVTFIEQDYIKAT
jgi:hypothetical protein